MRAAPDSASCLLKITKHETKASKINMNPEMAWFEEEMLGFSFSFSGEGEGEGEEGFD